MKMKLYTVSTHILYGEQDPSQGKFQKSIVEKKSVDVS